MLMTSKSGLFARAMGAVACLALLTTSMASAEVLTDKSPEAKHRKDVGKQTAKFVACLAKAAIKCEKGGASSGVDCDLSNPPASTHPDPKGKVIPKFLAAIAKCEMKVNLTKKGPASDYTLFGCPGDSDPVTSGDQPYTDLTDFQAGLSQNTRDQLSLLTPAIDILCGGPNSTDPAVIACTELQANGLLKYAKGVFKCQEKCENDYQNKKGNGGPTDSAAQCAAGDAGADSNFKDCVNGVLAKAQKKGALIAGLVTAVNAAVNKATNDLYNQNDCP